MEGEGGVTHCGVTGIVTPSVASAFLTDSQKFVERVGADALIAHYERSIMAIAPEQLLNRVRAMIHESRHGGLALPVALVVRPEETPTWRRYALTMASHGIVRGVFTDVEQAERWAAEKARVYSALRAARSRTLQSES